MAGDLTWRRISVHSPEMNHRFWRDFRKVVKEANPDALMILAEHYGDATTWLSGDQWDTVMNYDAFMEPVSWFLTGLEKSTASGRMSTCCTTARRSCALCSPT